MQTWRRGEVNTKPLRNIQARALANDWETLALNMARVLQGHRHKRGNPEWEGLACSDGRQQYAPWPLYGGRYECHQPCGTNSAIGRNFLPTLNVFLRSRYFL